MLTSAAARAAARIAFASSSTTSSTTTTSTPAFSYCWQQACGFARDSQENRHGGGKRGNKKGGAKGGKDAAGAGGDAAAAAAGDYQEASAPTNKDATRVVLAAIDNVVPQLDVRTTKASTKVTLVPGLMPPNKGRSLALRWLVQAATARKRSSSAKFAQCLAMELLMAYNKQGTARQKRDELHKLALQNRANLHLRWW